MAKTETSVKYTVKEIVEKIHEETTAHGLKLDAINTQVQLTNGRVTKLEKVSWGSWITRNPFKFAIIVAGLTVLLISDFRQPVVEKLIGFFL